jgi:hypothetical protein
LPTCAKVKISTSFFHSSSPLWCSIICLKWLILIRFLLVLCFGSEIDRIYQNGFGTFFFNTFRRYCGSILLHFSLRIEMVISSMCFEQNLWHLTINYGLPVPCLSVVQKPNNVISLSNSIVIFFFINWFNDATVLKSFL